MGPLMTTFEFVPTDAGGTHLRALCVMETMRGRIAAPLVRRELDSRFGVGLSRMADFASADAAGSPTPIGPTPSLRPAAEQIAGVA
jgi:hypothetical protein